MQRLSATISPTLTTFSVAGDFTQHLVTDEFEVGFLTNVPVNLTAFADLYLQRKVIPTELLPPEYIYIFNDSTTKTTYFGVDFFASKPLYYGFLQDDFLIDSDLSALIKRFEKLHLNHAKIASYFDWNQDDNPANNATFYTEISKLLPAQTAIFQDNNLTFSFPEIQSVPFSQAVVAFKELFVDSVKNRIPEKTVAANLSGGLDSSAVVSVLSQRTDNKPLTIYFNANTHESDESEFVNEVVNSYNLHHYIVEPPIDLYQELITITDIIGQPDPGVLPAFIHSQIIEKAAELDMKFIVSGHGGDSITGYGYDYLTALVVKNDWKSLKKATTSYESLRTNAKSTLLRQLFASHIRKALRNKKFIHAINLGIIAWLKFDVFFPALFLSGRKMPVIKSDKNFANRLLFKGESQEKLTPFDSHLLFGDLPKTQKEYVDFNFVQLAIGGNEVLSLLAHRADKVISFPFFDKKLLLSQLHATPQQRFGNGYTRGVIREALSAFLPEKISKRTSKADFTEFAYATFVNLNVEFKRNFTESHAVWKYVDQEVYAELVNLILSNNFTPVQKVKHTWLAMRVINFAVWLDNQSFEK